MLKYLGRAVDGDYPHNLGPRRVVRAIAHVLTLSLQKCTKYWAYSIVAGFLGPQLDWNFLTGQYTVTYPLLT